ncbi:MAG: hypothetical protein ACOYK7_07935 [Pirellulales bacterium]
MDRLDAAFLARLTTAPRAERRPAVPPSRPVPPTTRIEHSTAQPALEQAAQPALEQAAQEVAPRPGVAPVVGVNQPAQAPGRVAPIDRSGPWEEIADRLADTGCRVVGLAGAGTAAGIDALAARLATVLGARGRRVEQRTGPVLWRPSDADGDDSDVVLVVGGDWFPTGPVNARRLIGKAWGCEAAVLLRPPERPPCPAHAAALDALGVTLLATIDAADLGDPVAAEPHA